MAGFFKLPRLQYRLAIVDGTGRPTATFMDFFNVQFAGKIEAQENAQEATLAALAAVQAEQAAQLGLIIAAQATADEALALAEGGAGAKYININGAIGSNTASEATIAKPNVLLSIEGTIDGATLSTNTDWIGSINLYETLGATTNLLLTLPITFTPNGIILPGPEYATDPVNFDGTAVGALDGAITYTVEYIRTSGSTMATGGTIASRLTLTPEAS